MSKEIYVVFDNRSNYDYCFNIKELVKKFEGEFNCSRENTEKQKNFLVSITKEVKRIGKTREFAKTISYKLQFIDSTRFMAILLSNFYDNLTEGVHYIKYKYGHDNKKWETCGVECKDCECFLEYTIIKDAL